MMKKTLIISLVALVLSGCQTTRQNATTGEYETSSTVSGGVIGCVGGAIVGGLVGGGRGAAIGCGAGGGTGMLIGNSLDNQEAELRRQLLNSGVQVKRYGDQIHLVMNGSITFNTGKATLKRTIVPRLEGIAKVMNRYPDSVLSIEGHTDSSGDAGYNQSLSVNRAQNVRSVLSLLGLSQTRTKAIGYGESLPRCENTTAKGRECNRRVEIKIHQI